MKKDNRDIEKRIRKESQNLTPEVWNEVQKDIKNGKGDIVDMPTNRKKGKILSLISTVAAALVLISAVTFAVINYDRIDKNAVSTLYLETNPQIEISLNAYNKVLDVTAKNEDGKKVLGTMEFKDTQLDLALNAILGSMLKNGYLNLDSNTVLISVKNKERTKAEQLQTDVLKCLSNPLDDGFKLAAVVQRADWDDDTKYTAETLHISNSKVEFIEFIQKIGVKSSKDDLAKLSLHELNLIFQSQKSHSAYEYKNQVDYEIYGGVGYKGAAKDTKYLNLKKVKEIVFKDAKVKEIEITDFEAELEFDYGKMVYEVEFDKGNTEYKYLLDAVSGEFMNTFSVKPNVNSPKEDVASKESDSISSFMSSLVASQNTSFLENQTSSKNKLDAIIPPEYAFVYACVHAGVEKKNAIDVDVEIDMENPNNYHYDVEFKANGFEYDYEIDAISGRVIKAEKEIDDQNNVFGNEFYMS